ncbi:MAG: hypothetical protein ACRC2T_06255 [Thermoguttaceae bacterium]
MRTKIKIGSLLIFILVAGLYSVFFAVRENSGAETTAPDATTEQLMLERRIETFFTNLTSSSGNTTRTAFDDLFRDVLSSRSTTNEVIEQLVSKYTELKNSGIGFPRGCERLETKCVGKDLIIMKYLFKYDNYPVVWYFTFYKSVRTVSTVSPTTISSGTQNWFLIGVRFDTNLEPLLLGN